MSIAHLIRGFCRLPFIKIFVGFIPASSCAFDIRNIVHVNINYGGYESRTETAHAIKESLAFSLNSFSNICRDFRQNQSKDRCVKLNANTKHECQK
jgi:hypothetical protein